jgi:hypothetical protein
VGMRFMLARIGSVMFWLAIILCAVMDFTTTILVCIIVVGIGWAGWYAAQEEIAFT